jgi:uncharacterized membrane protein
MQIKRILSHLLYRRRRLRRAFPPTCLARIEACIREAESGHSGEIRFAVEAALEGPPLWRNQAARERAIDVFSQLRVWDTEHNNGILIYLLMADHDVEIVADRGVNARVAKEEWEKICREMEHHFRNGSFEAGLLAGIHAVAGHLRRHYPKAAGHANEIPDDPVIL